VRHTTFKARGGGAKKKFSNFKGSQAVPARPSDRGTFEKFTKL
jgi:hypothetical protein